MSPQLVLPLLSPAVPLVPGLVPAALKVPQGSAMRAVQAHPPLRASAGAPEAPRTKRHQVGVAQDAEAAPRLLVRVRGWAQQGLAVLAVLGTGIIDEPGPPPLGSYPIAPTTETLALPTDAGRDAGAGFAAIAARP